MIAEATEEQAGQTAFAVAEETQSTANELSWLQRAEADTSWLSPTSGDTAKNPPCAQWDGPCVGDPFRYADVTGADGNAFYSAQATTSPFVFYDSQCARLSGRVWAPAGSAPGDALPGIVIQNGSLEAPETLYWWAAEALVRDGYVVMTFDPRGQGRSDARTPSGAQGGNVNITVFWTGLVDAIDFFRSTPLKLYPNNVTCKNSYPTVVAPYDPYWNRIDPARLGIAGHSAGAIGVSIVQGYGAPGGAPWPGKIDATNPVDAVVAWDGMAGPSGGDYSLLGQIYASQFPKFGIRAPTMGEASEYGPAPAVFTTPPPVAFRLNSYAQWVKAGVPVYEFTIRGSTHYDYSLAPGFPATSWCPNAAASSCENGWANPMAIWYTDAWFDRWLKKMGEPGYADADERLLDDDGIQGRTKMSWNLHSARSYPDRNGTMHVCTNIRGGCSDTGLGTNVRRARR